MGVDDDDSEASDDDATAPPDDTTIAEDLSHLRSMHGPPSSKAIYFDGKIANCSISILVDTGSSHDFVHPRLAEKLRLPLTRIRPFRVYVGNGESLVCSHVSRQTPVDLPGYSFYVDLHVLGIHGPDLILGMSWLESLGKVTHDYINKTMSFRHKDEAVTLKGIARPPRQLSLHALSVGLARGSSWELYELTLQEPTAAVSPTGESVEFPADLPPQILEILHLHMTVFQLPSGLPPSRPFDHRIHLVNSTKPVNVRPYRYPYFQKNEIEKQVRDMLEQGVIRRSHSPFSSPVLLVRKKDGTFRFCIDYRALNKATVPDHFPIPTADELFDELGSARYFSKLDLRSGYHQIRMHQSDIYKTAFRTHDGHFEFLVMPFGLTNAPSTFQAAMNAIFQDVLRKFVIVFFDDILVYSSSLEDHASHLTHVLHILEQNTFFVKISKCTFCREKVEYLGHLIAAGQLIADPEKIAAMVAWPTPTTLKQLRGFLGLTGYYRRFVANYAQLAGPLTDLLRKDAFQWTADAEISFSALKAAMTAAPVLRLPDFSKTFYLETDASNFGIGAVLMQDGHPLAFFSKKLGPRRRTSSTYHKELYAIVEAVQKWRQYLLGREFVIRSDQKSLRELLQQVIQTPEQQLYIRKLMGFKFRIEYKTGSSNKVADALSRRDEDDVTSAAALTILTHPLPDIISVLREETANSEDLCTLRQNIEAGTADPKFSFSAGLIYRERRIVVSSTSAGKQALLYEYHNTPAAGHPGFDRTFRRIAVSFYWPNMRKEVKEYVASCLECQSTKYSTQKPAGLLQPLPIPTAVWDDVSMDFITGLPPSRGYTTVMVVVDRLSKYAHFAALPARFDALRVARLFIDTVVKHHGFPKTLVSDRDPVFLSDTWAAMLSLSGTKLCFSTAYHPQSDGQTEVRNRGLEQYLRAFVADKPSQWANYLPWAELALNCFHHAGLGTSPFRALYGREPPELVASPPRSSAPPAVADLIQQRCALLVDLRRNLERAQQQMVDGANRHRRHVEFKVGELVLLKLQQYRQHSVAKPLSSKLSRRYFGPFKVLERIGPVAYRLQLPDGARIHNVFHVSLLRRFVSSDSQVVAGDLPTDVVDHRVFIKPIRILEKRISLHRGAAVEQAPVQWDADNVVPPTWEPLSSITSQFPSLLEDKEVSMGAGVDTSTAKDEGARETTEGTESTCEQTEVVQEMRTRPRRVSKRPAKFRDFVLQ